MIPSIGPLEIAIVLIIALVVLGPKRLPETARSMGRGMREFKDSITGGADDDDERETKRVETTATAAPAATPVEPRT